MWVNVSVWMDVGVHRLREVMHPVVHLGQDK